MKLMKHAMQRAADRLLEEKTPSGVPYWFASAILPGMGQICQFRPALGILWCVCVIAAYFYSLPLGLLLHFLCVIESYDQRRRLRG
jgi:hypothetical protein